MYEVLLERTAQKDLRNLDASTYRRCIEQLKLLKSASRPHGSRKLVGSKNDWRIRVGDYRILYEIDDSTKQIKVFRIRHRKEVYY